MLLYTDKELIDRRDTELLTTVGYLRGIHGGTTGDVTKMCIIDLLPKLAKYTDLDGSYSWEDTKDTKAMSKWGNNPQILTQKQQALPSLL